MIHTYLAVGLCLSSLLRSQMTENNERQSSFVLVKGLAGRKGKSAFMTPKHQYLLTCECCHLSHRPISTLTASGFSVVWIDHSWVHPGRHRQSEMKDFISRLCIGAVPRYPATDLLPSNLCLVAFRISCF